MIAIRDKSFSVELDRFIDVQFVSDGGKPGGMSATTVRVTASMDVLGEREGVQLADMISAFFEGLGA